MNRIRLSMMALTALATLGTSGAIGNDIGWDDKDAHCLLMPALCPDRPPPAPKPDEDRRDTTGAIFGTPDVDLGILNYLTVSNGPRMETTR